MPHNQMAAGDPRRRPCVVGNKGQWPHAAVVLLHVIATDLHRWKQPCHRCEQIADLRLVGPGLCRITDIGNVSGAHEHEFGAEGKHEDGPAVGRLRIDSVVGQRSPQWWTPHHEVTSLRAANQPTAGGPRAARKDRC